MLKRLISTIPLIIFMKMWNLTSLGILGVVGFLIGYAIKKLVKLLLFFLGLFLLLLLSLEQTGAIKIYYDKLGEVVMNGLNSFYGVLPEVLPILSGLFYSLSFAAGFLLGLMKG